MMQRGMEAMTSSWKIDYVWKQCCAWKTEKQMKEWKERKNRGNGELKMESNEETRLGNYDGVKNGTKTTVLSYERF